MQNKEREREKRYRRKKIVRWRGESQKLNKKRNLTELGTTGFPINFANELQQRTAVKKVLKLNIHAKLTGLS